jgi:class 3 adenylate cyclase
MPIEVASPSTSPGSASAAARGDLERLTLRFPDEDSERAFRAEHFRNAIGSVRAAHVLGIGAWLAWVLVVGLYAVEETEVDLLARFGLMVPVLLVGLAVTMLPIAPRVWEAEVVCVNLIAVVLWTVSVTAWEGVPFDLGYIGVVFIMAFSFTLNRLRFVLMSGEGIAAIVMYFVVVVALGGAEVRQLVLALSSLASFYVLGSIASYILERSERLLFLRERQLDRERRRSEGLLLNVLPEAIAARLKDRAEAEPGRPDEERVLADAYAEVAVLFADLAGFTEQAGRTSPDALVATLNDLFLEMDEVADRHGLEKIKTVGDAYMAVAGVPIAVTDPADRAMEMALDLVSALEGRSWPSGDPVAVRVGIAIGPVVAGVIGRRKFAYDVWGDTVNLASRLQAAGQPGSILVAESAVEHTTDRFEFGPSESMDLKGKGPQTLRALVGRRAPAEVRSDRTA